MGSSGMTMGNARCLACLVVLGLWLICLPGFGGERPADFSAIRQGLADGSFVPIAFQRPNVLISKNGPLLEVGNLRWEVHPKSKTPWYDVPHRYVTAVIDPRKARHVYVGRQTCTPLFIHSFLVISFDEGGLVCNGQSSQGLVLTVEPLLRHDQHSLMTPVNMLKGVYPKVYQLATWENFAVFCGGVMKQMAWLRPLRTKDPQTARRLAEAMVRAATASPAAERFDYAHNNCGSSLFPIIRAGLPAEEAAALTGVLEASSKPDFARWVQKHLEQASLLDSTKPVRLYGDHFYVPLEDLCKGFFPKPVRVP